MQSVNSGVSESNVNSELHKTIKRIYYDPADPGSFGGVDRLFRRVKEKLNENKTGNIDITRSDIKKFLTDQASYSLHRPAKKSFQRNPTRVSGIDQQWQADLADMQGLSRFNRGNRYILTVIDVFSKYAWAIPIKSKSSSDLKQAFENLFEKRAKSRLPSRLQTDKGKEFLNKPVQEMFHKHDIEHFTTWSDMKAAIVERFNRTLKSRLWQYFSAKQTRTYIDVLDDIVAAYNNSFHRSIQMTPRQASEKQNEQSVWTQLYCLPSSSSRGGGGGGGGEAQLASKGGNEEGAARRPHRGLHARHPRKSIESQLPLKKGQMVRISKVKF